MLCVLLISIIAYRGEDCKRLFEKFFIKFVLFGFFSTIRYKKRSKIPQKTLKEYS